MTEPTKIEKNPDTKINENIAEMLNCAEGVKQTISDHSSIMENNSEPEIISKTKFHSFYKGENLNEEENAGENNEQIAIEERQKEILNFIKQQKKKIPYAILAIILWIAYQIRVSNIPLMRDITTQKLIPIDPDSFVFLRYAKYLLGHGTLQYWDTMRYVPYGFNPQENLLGTSYVSVIIFKIISFFNPAFTIDSAHVYYPPIVFVFGMIFFYLLVKRLFDFRISLLATTTLAFIPIFLFRTMAGVSDKESAGFLFYFLILYLFVRSWQETNTFKSIMWGLFSGLSTALMAYTWGGVKFIYLTIGGFILVEIFLNKFKEKDFYSYSAWFSMMIGFSIIHPNLLGFKILLTSFTSGIIVIAFGVGLVYHFLINKNLFNLKKTIEKKTIPGLACLIITVFFGVIILSGLYGPAIIPQKAENIYTDLINPYGKDRWQLTVAENHQPFLTDWVGQMGWFYILLFFIGSGVLFYELLNPIKTSLKELKLNYINQFTLTILYGLFIYFFVFSRYSQNSTYFNGVSTISKFAYIGSIIIFSLILFGIYLYSYYIDKRVYENIKLIDKKYILLIIWFIIALVGARGAIRLLMVLAPITAIIASYFIFKMVDYSLALKDKRYKYAALGLIILLVGSPYALGSTLSEGYLVNFYKQISGSAQYSGPGYDRQWQIAGQWVRENTPTDSVFAHWWDYGYFVQTGFERATITDGGNAHGYWNYQIGRHVLTAQNEIEALEVLYAHNATYLLIISDEIGKYTAYSSIGSDKNYDRYSWITSFRLDPQRTQETRDQTILFYGGSYVLDDDFVYEGQIYPRQGAGIGGIFLPFETRETFNENNETITVPNYKQPTAALFFNNQRKDVPIECLYVNGVKTTWDTPGLKGCFRIEPIIENNQMDPIGAGLYVSEEGVHALWTQLFLFNKGTPNFELVYDDSNQMPLALYQGRQIGPLKIWKINYPKDFKVSEEKLKLYQGFTHENPDSLII